MYILHGHIYKLPEEQKATFPTVIFKEWTHVIRFRSFTFIVFPARFASTLGFSLPLRLFHFFLAFWKLEYSNDSLFLSFKKLFSLLLSIFINFNFPLCYQRFVFLLFFYFSVSLGYILLLPSKTILSCVVHLTRHLIYLVHVLPLDFKWKGNIFCSALIC